MTALKIDTLLNERRGLVERIKKIDAKIVELLRRQPAQSSIDRRLGRLRSKRIGEGQER